ncbi:MAG: NAD-dependent epimerase/dehydratase family protein [Alphaproteobacteria bacterium]|nr:NAD-dependent epimerase/dehydratase family protein [Alphaproteobacteria bacterium]
MTGRVLVTGGTGFLGAALVRRLVALGREVRVLDNNWRGNPRRLVGILDRVDLVEADIRDAAAVAGAAKGCDRVVHMASVNGTAFFYSQPELVLDVGIRGILAVVDACRKNGIGDLVVASSSEVYQTPPKVPTDESAPLIVPDPLNPRYSYGGQKLASELIALNYGRTGFGRVAVFRPHNVYGPDMGFEHVVPELALRADDQVKAQPAGKVRFAIQGDGRQTRAFIHVDDFTTGLVTVIDKAPHLSITHIGNPEELTIAEVARKIVGCFGREAELVFGDSPAGQTPRRSPDIGRLRKLGFEPKIPFAEGIAPVVDWYAKNRHLKPEEAK